MIKIKKKKNSKKYVIKMEIKFQAYKSCLEAAQIKNKINHLQKPKIGVDSLKQDHKVLIKKNKL